MSEWKTAFCEANGIKIHYMRTGGSKPPVVLLHGLAANGACWTNLARALEDEFDVIMPDARGHGKSGVPDEGYRYEDLADDVTALFRSLGLSSPVLLGHSMGGLTAAVVASRRPNLLRGLILADPTFLSPEYQREVFESGVGDQHRQMVGKSAVELVAEARKRHPDRSPDTLELIARARLQTSIKAFDVLTPPNPEYAQLVSAIEVQTLLVTADAGVVTPAMADELRRINPKIRVEHIAEAGHGLQYDQPGQFAAAVKSFLRAIVPAVES